MTITIDFFDGPFDGTLQKEYGGSACAIRAELDMDEHIKAGGWCMATLGNKSVMVTNLRQLLINQESQ